MQSQKKIPTLTVLLLLVPLLIACSTPNQWIADSFLDKLCAKDGKIKVYETVTLPKERFNQVGQFIGVSGISFYNEGLTYEYYLTSEEEHIQNAYSEFDGLLVSRNHFFVYRQKNHKLLGEMTQYSRFGGDVLFTGYMGSSYTCPKQTVDDLLRQIFLKSN